MAIYLIFSLSHSFLCSLLFLSFFFGISVIFCFFLFEFLDEGYLFVDQDHYRSLLAFMTFL